MASNLRQKKAKDVFDSLSRPRLCEISSELLKRRLLWQRWRLAKPGQINQNKLTAKALRLLSLLRGLLLLGTLTELCLELFEVVVL